MLPLVNIKEFRPKYGLELFGNKRLYNITLINRPYGVERSRPYYLKLNDFETNENNWIVQIVSLFNYLQESYPKTKEELLNFRVAWSKARIFGEDKFITNSAQTKCGLYISVNFTGAHSIWFVQDLIIFYDPPFEEYKFLVRTPCMNEPEEVKTAIKNLVVENFKSYLQSLGKNEKSTTVILKNIEFLNKHLVELNVGWNDFFLIDELDKYSLIKSRLFAYIRKEHLMSEEKIPVADRSLKYLYNFLNN